MQQVLVLILGKRLVNNRLTPEGHSRVNALIRWLMTAKPANAVIGFCGGYTGGQSVSESSAMLAEFQRQCSVQELPLTHMTTLVEETSTNTIENIESMASMLVQRGVFAPHQSIDVILVSSDYHLKRVFAIQQLMEEQGLLRRLVQQSGHALSLHIERDLNRHILAPYPYCSDQAALFLLMDEITPYRVYLEGVVSGVFQRPLEPIRREPLKMACNALSLAQTLCRQRGEGAAIHQALFEIEQAILETTPELPLASIRTALTALNDQLLRLNRYFDPEQSADEWPSVWA